MYKFVLLGLLAALCSATPTLAETVAGSVSGTWTHEQSPYVVTGDLLVPRGARLEIQSRVEVIFTGHYQLVVEGTLVVDGSRPRYKEDDDHHVVFKASAAATDGWAGIRFLQAESGCKFKNVVVSGGNATGSSPANLGGAIYCDHTDLEIVNAAFSDCRAEQGGAALAVVDSKVELTNAAFSENSCPLTGGTIYVSAGELDMTNAALSENRGVGVYLEQQSEADLTNFALTEHKGDYGWGIWCTGSELRMTNAAVSENSAGGIKLVNNSEAKLTTSAVSGKNAFFSDETSQMSSTLSAISKD